jgi:hypothetical protein
MRNTAKTRGFRLVVAKISNNPPHTKTQQKSTYRKKYSVVKSPISMKPNVSMGKSLVDTSDTYGRRPMSEDCETRALEVNIKLHCNWCIFTIR